MATMDDERFLHFMGDGKKGSELGYARDRFSITRSLLTFCIAWDWFLAFFFSR